MPEAKNEGDADYGVSETMREEETRMREISEKDEEKRQKKLEQDRKKDLDGGSAAMDSKYKALEYLLSQSKVGRVRNFSSRGVVLTVTSCTRPSC